MLEDSSSILERLQKLSEFRFQMRKFLNFSEIAADAAGISAQQYQLMQVISVSGPKGAAISHLAERMFLRHNSAVELVDRAVRAGLVRRDSDEDDLRRSLVTMTPAGSELLYKLVGQHLAELDKTGPGLIEALQRVLDSAPGKEAVEPTA